MAQYLLSVHSVEGPQIEAPQPVSPEEMQLSYAQVAVLEGDLKSAGAWVFGGRLHARLDSAHHGEGARQIRVDRGSLHRRCRGQEHLGPRERQAVCA